MFTNVSFETVATVIVTFAILAVIVERALYQIFDTKLWKKLEELLDDWAGGDFYDLKPWLSDVICIMLAWQLKLDMIQALYHPGAEAQPYSIILTGLFIAGGSTGVYKFFKRLRKVKEAAKI